MVYSYYLTFKMLLLTSKTSVVQKLNKLNSEQCILWQVNKKSQLKKNTKQTVVFVSVWDNISHADGNMMRDASNLFNGLKCT